MAVDIAKIVLVPHERSIHFAKRDCTLSESLKVGRSVDKKRILTNNLIFDCRVLSRNHALIWFENGKFFIKDTKSSNGTFVNEARLSSSGEESPPRELKTRDIVQFGVNVNVEKKAHGCIIAGVRLLINDTELPGVEPPVQQVLQIIQSAVIREQELETKLVSMQTAIEGARQLATESMLALVREDELLSRLEMLENQLQIYVKNSSEDELKTQLAKAYDAKHNSDVSSKNSMRNILQEKLEYVSKVNQLQRDYDKAEQECQRYRTLYDAVKQEHSQDVTKLSDQLKQAEEEKNELQDKLTKEKQTLSSNISTLQAETEYTKEQLLKAKQRLEETQDELVNVKITLETERQRKAAGKAVSADEESLLLGTGSFQCTDTVELPLKTVAELESVQPAETDSTNEDGSHSENDKGVTPTEDVVGSISSQAVEYPNEVLKRRSTLISHGDTLLTGHILTILKESEERTKGLENELKESENTVKRLQVRLAEYVQQENSRNEFTIQELARQVSESAITKGQIDLLQVSLEEAKDRIHQLEGELTSGKSTMDDLQKRLMKLQGELDESHQLLEDRETEITRVTEEVRKKTRALESLRRSEDHHVKESTTASASVSTFNDEVSILQDKYTKQLKESVRVKTENTELVRKIEDLKQELDRTHDRQSQASDGHLQKRVKLLTIIALVSIGVALASWLT